MLIYDLNCSQGHQFEGWFKNLADLKAQLRKNMIACPICGDLKIEKKPSTFGTVKSYSVPRQRAIKMPAAQLAPAHQAAHPGPAAIDPAEYMRQLEQVSHTLETEFDDMGSEFTNEALKMHYGVADKRNIRGVSTPTQEDMLRKEGINFFKVPMLVKKKRAPKTSDKN